MSRTYAADDFDFIRKRMFENLGQKTVPEDKPNPPGAPIGADKLEEYERIFNFYTHIYKAKGWLAGDGEFVYKYLKCCSPMRSKCPMDSSFDCVKMGKCTSVFAP